MAMASAATGYDRLAELKAFDDTKAGVKGLVDAGVTAVPRIFHHPQDPAAPRPPLSHPTHHHDVVTNSSIPVIDLSGLGLTRRPELVAQVKAAAKTVGFFQVVNHGVPDAAMSEMLASVRRFNEAPAEARRPFYTRDASRRVKYSSKYDLFWAPAASWRDTLFLDMAPVGPSPEEIPPACRDIVFEYTRQVQALCSALLSEAMGLHVG
ncbi:hypothetical protein QOZ80_2BG0159490 [Eleusine coracana subsp. coracana]|nr:hypothetical protein QOZ80_2BG0159490 [Eleusine coracana subsp. coracana]